MDPNDPTYLPKLRTRLVREGIAARKAGEEKGIFFPRVDVCLEADIAIEHLQEKIKKLEQANADLKAKLKDAT